MNDSVTLFFFVNNNHIQNVRTLQSIYTQDYPSLRLIICNDCTYGFESQRLLNNFREGKPDNVEQILFHENPVPMGEYASQSQFWPRLNTAFFLTIHSGERFTAPSSISDCVRSLRSDSTLSAAVTGVELWDDAFANRLSATAGSLSSAPARDCQVLYRISALQGLSLVPDRHDPHISRLLIPHLLETGHRVVTLPLCLCKYSHQAVTDTPVPLPTTLGSETLANIDALLQNRQVSNPAGDLFGSTLPAPKQKKPNRRLVLLYKLSTLSWIRSCAIAALLLLTAGALFLNLQTPLALALGIGLLVCAAGAFCVTGGLVLCNLYFKRNPQRLVNQNGK